MVKTKVLVTGANGQLGQCIKDLSKNVLNMEFVFTSSKTLDITKKVDLETLLQAEEFEYCINCAAYTAVDKAEQEEQKAYSVNCLGVKNVAELCNINNITLIHISTDFVFNGLGNKPYKEVDETIPISVYGKTKLEGEKVIKAILNQHFIIRTSWLFSEYNNNFVKTMLKLSENRNELNVINDQIGTPTYAMDLAKSIINIIERNNKDYGLYHYSNTGVASWYDFAKAIFKIKDITIKIQPIATDNYPTPARRPHYSVLNKEKIKNSISIAIPYWRDSLKECLDKLV